MILNAIILLVPASFAYAVFKQRVLDVPVLLQRSARYVLVQRGFLVLLCFISFGLTLAFAASLAHLAPLAIGGQSPNALGAVFGTALLWGGSQVHRQVSGKIDRAFFRGPTMRESFWKTWRRTRARRTGSPLLTCFSTNSTQLCSRHHSGSICPGNGDMEAVAGGSRRRSKPFPPLRPWWSNWPVGAALGRCWRRCTLAAWSPS